MAVVILNAAAKHVGPSTQIRLDASDDTGRLSIPSAVSARGAKGEGREVGT